MKRFLLLICIAFTVVPAEAQRVFSLDDCIQTGLEPQLFHPHHP